MNNPAGTCTQVLKREKRVKKIPPDFLNKRDERTKGEKQCNGETWDAGKRKSTAPRFEIGATTRTFFT